MKLFFSLEIHRYQLSIFGQIHNCEDIMKNTTIQNIRQNKEKCMIQFVAVCMLKYPYSNINTTLK